MYEPDENPINEDREVRSPDPTVTEKPFADEPSQSDSTDRVNGEYHYKNGYTQKIYSDAHYVPADENTVPPRYYTPPEKAVKEPKAKKSGSGTFVKALCLCLVCAILGGLGGAAIMGGTLSKRINALEAAEEERALPSIADNSVPSAPVPAVSTDNVALSAIYDAACQQVVGITTEVTYTNFFGMTSSSAVTGSGFVATEDGYIITNCHVIEYAYDYNYAVTVMFHDGSQYEATIVGVEPDNDIAVLKIDATGLTPVVFGDSDTISVGDDAYPVGNPLGELEFTMTFGRVSALDRLISTEESSQPINMFQIDAAVNSGNSGGPVYNARGEVIGIVTAKASGNSSSAAVDGLGFAIPVNDAVRIADDLITKGYVTGKAYMGVSLDNRYNSMYSQFYGLPQGAYVYYVEAGGPADKAGIRGGDIITKLGDSEITSDSDLTRAIKQFSAGDTTSVTVYRTNESITMDITFDEATNQNSVNAAGQNSGSGKK